MTVRARDGFVCVAIDKVDDDGNALKIDFSEAGTPSIRVSLSKDGAEYQAMHQFDEDACTGKWLCVLHRLSEEVIRAAAQEEKGGQV